tara:strand:+ start:1057 stop:1179 length:123 start_codon:yes stop_codon:yes gene_type:complete
MVQPDYMRVPSIHDNPLLALNQMPESIYGGRLSMPEAANH